MNEKNIFQIWDDHGQPKTYPCINKFLIRNVSSPLTFSLDPQILKEFICFINIITFIYKTLVLEVRKTIM